MNYDKQKIETGPSSETQRTEAAANKFFDMAEMGPGAKDQKAKEMFSAIGRETAQGNYDMGQRILESGAIWDDNLRGLASEINQLDRERIGAKPMTIEDVQNTISDYARDFEKISKEKGGRQSDLEGSMALDNIVGDISEPGLEGIDNALDYLEGTLKSKGNIADSILKSTTLTPEDKAAFLKDWQEKRAIRDALYQEKQRRLKQQQEFQRQRETVLKEQKSTSIKLENLFSQASASGDVSLLRQEFSTKVQNMSAQELRFLNDALQKVTTEFVRTQNPEVLKKNLTNLASQSFRAEDVATRQKQVAEKRIDEIRTELGIDTTSSKEKERSIEDDMDSKIKFNTTLQKFIEAFQDGTLTNYYRDFIMNKPTPEQYGTATDSLQKLYNNYMGDDRFRSEKLEEYKKRLEELSQKFNPNRLKFQDYLKRLEEDLGIPSGYGNIYQMFGSLYGNGIKSTPEQWSNASKKITKFMSEYYRDKRSRSQKTDDWHKRIIELSQNNFS